MRFLLLLFVPPQDLKSNKEVMDPIPDTSADVTWANDNTTLFYVVKDHLDRWVGALVWQKAGWLVESNGFVVGGLVGRSGFVLCIRLASGWADVAEVLDNALTTLPAAAGPTRCCATPSGGPPPRMWWCTRWVAVGRAGHPPCKAAKRAVERAVSGPP